MKHNIEGFDQKKLVELGIDARMAIVLRWFVDFAPNMATVSEGEKTYLWVKYDYVCDELPIIASNKYAVKRIFDKFVEVGLMEFYLWKNKGNYSTYRLVPEVYNGLISDTLLAKVLEGSSKSAKTPSSKSARTKDSSITPDYSIKSFIPPTQKDVENYVIEKQLVINPYKFHDWYSKTEWKDNKGKQIKNWKMKAINWDSREKEKKPDAIPYSKPLTIQYKVPREKKKCPKCGGDIRGSACVVCYTNYDYNGDEI